MHNPTELTQQTINQLVANTEPWLSCDDCFEQADLAIEALLDADTPFSEEFRVHLQACAVCHEEAESLATLVAADHSLSVEAAVNRIARELANAG